MEPLKRLNRELVKKGNIIELYEDTVQSPDGTVQHYDYIRHHGAAAVLPVMDDGKILMVKQYRNAVDRFTLELPAGGRNGDEPTIECAARELEEETGYYSKDLEQLLSLKTTVAFCDELIDIYLARNLKKSHQNLDEGEFVDVYAYDIEELVRMVSDFTIQDAKTIAAVMTYYANYVLKK